MKHSTMHGFDVEVATLYGLEEAVIIHNFQFWLNKNYSEGSNRKDNHTWTYNTAESLAKLFPYMTARAVRYAIDNLVKKEVLIKGCYNKAGYDRTTWYAFNNEAEWLYAVQSDFAKNTGQSHLTKTANGIDEIVGSHLTKTANGIDEIVAPIPDIKHQIVNSDSKQQIKAVVQITKKSDSMFDDFYSVYPKKENRAAAKKAWSKVPSELHQAIIADVINRAANHEGWRERQFIPQPSAYLNQERWTDEIRQPQQSRPAPQYIPPEQRNGSGIVIDSTASKL